ncbi:MAG: DUF1588 domain-containing protein, partial [Planctomycetota bacterium]
FSLQQLGTSANVDSIDDWISSLERVEVGEMPPAKHNRMTAEEKRQLQQFLRQQITRYEQKSQRSLRTPTRRLNNREFENSVRDVLGIAHVGSHGPMDGLLGDTLHDGFDTHGETLGFSEYHLDQYVTAVRKVLDAVILPGDQPESRRYEITGPTMRLIADGNRRRADRTSRSNGGAEIRGSIERLACTDFPFVPTTGWYRIHVNAMALDRRVYDQQDTGIYDGDPITLRMSLGARHFDFDLPEDQTKTFETNVWLAAGTPLEFTHKTDGLRLIGNGNFKFQNRIARDYIQENDPQLYERVVRDEVPKAKTRSTSPGHWVHWVKYWQGARPWIKSVQIEGPLFRNWPPKRQRALLGENPSVKHATAILKPIAQRAWRRPVFDQELSPIVQLVQSQADTLGDVGALKEGIVAILVSPSFLMLNPENSSNDFRFASKLGYLINSTTPDAELIVKVRRRQLGSMDAVRDELQRRLVAGKMDNFLREFPYGWLQLDRINFMAPDIDAYPLYDKKRVNEDMVNEVLAFFRHTVEENRPIPELLTAGYSFVNADLAKVYGVDGVPDDSRLRKVVFQDGRRGGFLGMGAFLTLTADTLSTSPIHRAVYVMENFMGIHPAPPPADVEITEPDVRAARTIREVLMAHQSDASCAACHQNIDPFGYAFENFDPIGRWRDTYVDTRVSVVPDNAADGANAREKGKKDSKRRNRNLLAPTPIDASANFLNGTKYNNIREFRELMKSDANKKRFVRCFVTKLLTYANGIQPENFSEIEAIVKVSEQNDYRIVETIAAVIDSPMFREQKPKAFPKIGAVPQPMQVDARIVADKESETWKSLRGEVIAADSRASSRDHRAEGIPHEKELQTAQRDIDSFVIEPTDQRLNAITEFRNDQMKMEYLVGYVGQEVKHNQVRPLTLGQGSMSGEVSATSALLQTRLTLGSSLNSRGDLPGASGFVKFEWSTDQAFAQSQFTSVQQATADDDFIVRAVLKGLRPNQRYYFRAIHGAAAEAMNTLGPTCSFRTLPGPEQDSEVKFIVGSCMNYIKFMHGRAGNARGPLTATAEDKRLGFPAFATMSKLQPDFFVGTGDIVYYDNPFRVAKSIAELRQCWHEQFRFPRMIEFFRHVPTYWSKDDHDFRYNDSDNESQRAPLPGTGIDMFHEQLPIAPMDAENRLTYRTFRVGQNLQVWLTEGRDYRSANDALDGPEKTMWGIQQRQWLKKSLTASDARWKLMINPTPMVGPDLGHKQDNHVSPKGFRHEAQAFFDWVQSEKIDNLILVCGDRHWQYHSVHPSGIHEFSCGALNDENSRLGVAPGKESGSDPDGTIDQRFTSPEPSGGFLQITAGKTLQMTHYSDDGQQLYQATLP